MATLEIKMISIAYFTSRLNPKIEWFFSSLKRSLQGREELIKELIIIDYYADKKGRKEKFKTFFDQYYGDSDVNLIHITPKPCPMQGKDKVTKEEHFAAANARNTAFIVCSSDYIACVDDVSVMKIGWFDQVYWSYEHGNVILGAYSKVNKLKVKEDGDIESYEHLPTGVDSRLGGEDAPQGAIQVTGDWMFGCSFGLPIQKVEKVDGFDEACNLQGAEDYDFGIRLGRITDQIYYCRNMFTFESEELHTQPGNQKFVREAKMVTDKGLMPWKAGVMSDHAMLQRVRETVNPKPFIGASLLYQRIHYQTTGQFIVEYPKDSDGDFIDWRTGEKLKEC